MMFEKFDNSKRAPRPVQTDALKWIESNWNSSKVIALNLPTGSGKSAILRSIQVAFPGTVAMTPSNILLDQYRETYEDLNYLKGVENYQCHDNEEFSCQDVKNIGKKPCDGCPYKESRTRALTESTIFNPLSYYYFKGMKNYEPSDTVVIDEAHKLIDMLMLLVDISFRKGFYNYPEITNEVELLEWLKTLETKMADIITKYKKVGDYKKSTDYTRKAERIGFLVKSLSENPQEFVFHTKMVSYRGTQEEYLFIQPINPPKWILDIIFKDFKRVILMSATLTIDDMWKLGLKDYAYRDFPSPIPKQQRQVLYRPSGFKMNYQTEVTDIVRYIKGILADYPGQNTMIHVSYSWAVKLKPFFPNALSNTPETKTKVLEQFKKQGGIWIAAGCAEGLDLPDDLCRLTIIPLIVLGNPTDPLVKKQMALPGGRLRYEMQAIKTVIQQSGRSTRHEGDYSITVVGDNKFPDLILKNRKFIPISYLESIIWVK